MSITITESSLLPIRRDQQTGSAFVSGGGGGGGVNSTSGVGITSHSALSQLDYASSGHTGFQASLTTGIADTNSVVINAADVAVNDYAKFTATGLLGRSYAEVLSDIGAVPLDNPTFTTGISTPALKVTTGAGLGNILISDADGDLSYLGAGATTAILVGGGAANPVWTVATGTGAPVRAGDPTFTGTVNTTTIHGTTLLIDHIGEHTGLHSIVFDNSIKGESLESVTAFSSGFAGNGYKVIETGGVSSLEVDALTVRGTLKAYELQINKISSVNGGMIISIANAKCTAVVGTAIYFDEGNGLAIPFVVDDYIKAQQFTGTGVAAYLGKVIAVNAGNVIATTISGAPWAGMDLVQIGNSNTGTYAARQNAIYLTAADSNNPYIAGYAGITDGLFTGHEKFRLGNLTGITDATLSPSGFGLYAQNVFLSGKIVATSGTIGGFTISATDGLYSGTGITRVQMKPGAGFWAGDVDFDTADFGVSAAGVLHAKGNCTLGSETGEVALGAVGGNVYVNSALKIYGPLEYNTHRISVDVTLTYIDSACYALVSGNTTKTLTLPTAANAPEEGTIIRLINTGVTGDFIINGNGNNIYLSGASAVATFNLGARQSTSLMWIYSFGWYELKRNYTTLDVAGAVTFGSTLDVTGTVTANSILCTYMYSSGNIYAVGEVAASSFYDFTPFYEGDAISEIKNIKGKKGHIDHSTLPAFAQKTITRKDVSTKVETTETGRDLGAMVSILTVAVQQLTARIEKLEKI